MFKAVGGWHAPLGVRGAVGELRAKDHRSAQLSPYPQKAQLDTKQLFGKQKKNYSFFKRVILLL